MAGKVGRHKDHGTVGAGGREDVVDSCHVIIQPRHPEPALRTLGLVTLMRSPDVTLHRGWGLELLRTLGALVLENGLWVHQLLLLVANGLMPPK